MLAILTAHGEVSLVLPISLLLGGLVLIAAEFFLPTIILGFLGAAMSFTGIYLSAEAGGGVCLVFVAVFVALFVLEFVAFRRLLPRTGMGRAMTNVTSNDGAAVPTTASFAPYLGKTAVATTVLAPSGTIEVEGRLLEAFSLDGFVERGVAVTIIEAGAGRVTVRRVR
jgi:membrane-bound serine protease (ClpP class)